MDLDLTMSRQPIAWCKPVPVTFLVIRVSKLAYVNLPGERFAVRYDSYGYRWIPDPMIAVITGF